MDKVTEQTKTLPTVTVTKDPLPVENSTVSTPFNTMDVPMGIPQAEYRECYNTAYSAFINKGLTADEAVRKAREEIKKFIAGYDLSGSGAAVSSPITPDEEIDF